MPVTRSETSRTTRADEAGPYKGQKTLAKAINDSLQSGTVKGRKVTFSKGVGDAPKSKPRVNLKATETAQRHLERIAEFSGDGGPETNPDNRGVLKMQHAQRVANEHQNFFYWPKPTGSVKQPDVHCYSKKCSQGVVMRPYQLCLSRSLAGINVEKYTPFTLVYYHLECISEAMFARMSDKDGMRLLEVNLQDSLSADDIARIEGYIIAASGTETVYPAKSKAAKGEAKMAKAAKRRRRREAKAKAKARAKVMGKAKAGGDQVDDDSSSEEETETE